MPSYQGFSVIVILVVTIATQSVESFGGRRKNMAHIFGKRSSYTENLDNVRDLLDYYRTLSKPYKDSELRGLEYLFMPETLERGEGFPVVEPEQSDYSALSDDDSIDQSDIVRLRDIADLNDSESRKSEDIQDLLANYILSKIAKYEK